MPQVVPGARPSASRQAAATVHGCPARPEGAEGRLGTLLAPRGNFGALDAVGGAGSCRARSSWSMNTAPCGR